MLKFMTRDVWLPGHERVVQEANGSRVSRLRVSIAAGKLNNHKDVVNDVQTISSCRCGRQECGESLIASADLTPFKPSFAFG